MTREELASLLAIAMEKIRNKTAPVMQRCDLRGFSDYKLIDVINMSGMQLMCDMGLM